MKAWHWRAVVKSTYYQNYKHLNDPVIYTGNAESESACRQQIKEIVPYPPYRANVWYDPYLEIESGVSFPNCIIERK